MTTKNAPLYEEPKKKYRCPYCGEAITHAQARKHWEQLCPARLKRKLGR